MHRKEYGSQALPLKSMGLHRVCAGALRLIWALLFTEVSKTAAETNCPVTLWAARVLQLLLVILPCGSLSACVAFLLWEPFPRRARSSTSREVPSLQLRTLKCCNHEASPQLLETLQAQGEILLEVGKGGRNWSTTSSGQEISIYNPSSFIQSSHMQSS